MPVAPGVEDARGPRWATAAEALAVVLHRPHLRRTVGVAVVVGTILFAVNHLDTVVTGGATPSVWVKGAVTYLVPFVVANYGLLTASRRSRVRGSSRAPRSRRP